jgi:hypothetical protein
VSTLPRRVLALVLLLALPGCPLDGDSPDGGTPDAGGDGGEVVTPPLRDLTFGTLSLGDFSGATLAGVTLQVSAFNGNQTVQVQNLLGEGQDIILECGTLTLHAPENHLEAGFVFNDDNASLTVSVYDQNGQIFGRALDTHADRALLQVVRVDSIYSKFIAASSPGSGRLIGQIVISSCQGFLHEIALQ